MQQRQLRLGDILDDYCPRERRVTNHAVVAMVGDDVKQTRCATCETEHEYKHAKVPRQRRKTETPAALYAQVLASGPKRVVHGEAAHAEAHDDDSHDHDEGPSGADAQDDHGASDDAVHEAATPAAAAAAADRTGAEPAPEADESDEDDINRDDEEGPVHRPLIRASLPKHEGQAPPSRPIPEFTIRQPGGRPNRFRPRGAGGGGGGQFQGGGNRSNGNMPGGPRSGMRSSGGRPPQGSGGGMPSRLTRRQGPPGRKRSK